MREAAIEDRVAASSRSALATSATATDSSRGQLGVAISGEVKAGPGRRHGLLGQGQLGGDARQGGRGTGEASGGFRQFRAQRLHLAVHGAFARGRVGGVCRGQPGGQTPEKERDRGDSANGCRSDAHERVLPASSEMETLFRDNTV